MILHIGGLDSLIKLLGTQLTQGNSCNTLKNTINQFIEINNELMLLDKIIDHEKLQEKTLIENKRKEILEEKNKDITEMNNKLPPSAIKHLNSKQESANNAANQ